MTTILGDLIQEKKIFFSSSEDKFKSGIKSLFIAVPKLKEVKWTQITPTWNDGSVCCNSIEEVLFRIKDYDPEEAEDGFVSLYTIEVDKALSDEEVSLLSQFTSELYEIEDLLDVLFNTNKQISIARDGLISIEDYDGVY